MDTAATVTEAPPAHHHHWLIEEVSGLLSVGVCRYCHARREFRNWLSETDFITNTEFRSLRASGSESGHSRSDRWMGTA